MENDKFFCGSIQRDKMVKQKRIIYLLIGIVVLLGVVFRFLLLLNHFTHVDDVGVAISIIDYGKFNPEVSRIGRFEAYNRWTYAPLQFIFHALLVDERYSYILNVVMGRLPSFAFGCANILLSILFIRRITENKGLLLLSAVLSAFSWENAIYSAQMEPYSIAVFFVWIVLFIFMSQSRLENKVLWRKGILLPAILTTLACYAQYQMFMVVFALYISLFLYFFREKKYIRLKGVLIASIFNFIVTVPMLLIIRQRNLLGSGVNWNVGIGGIFNFALPVGTILTKACYILNFFTTNLFLCIKYFFVPDVPVISDLITIILLIFMVTGFCYSHRKKMKLVCFIDTYILLFTLMILAGKLTLGPSRHVLVLYPVWLVLICIGLCAIGEGIKHRKFYNILQNGLIISICVLFAISVKAEFLKRVNLFTEDLVQDVINVYEPNVIVSHAWAFDLYLMNHFEQYENESLYNTYGLLYKKGEACLSSGDRVVFISRTVPIDHSNFDSLWEKIRTESALENDGNVNHFDDLFLVKEYRMNPGAEVDYASNYYENFKNGLTLQIYVAK